MNLFYQPEITNGIFHLDTDESKHCIKVLRRRAGDEINLVDGRGCFYTARITSANPKRCEFEITAKTEDTPRNFHVHIAIAPTKNIDRIEWFVEKATEIGIDEISLIVSHKSERKVIKSERLEKKAIAAMKQSLKARLPKINKPTGFTDFISIEKTNNKFIAQVDPENPGLLGKTASPGTRCCVLIGPEGDFTDSEVNAAIENKWIKVSLGNSRLRTETAGLVACHILNLINE